MIPLNCSSIYHDSTSPSEGECFETILTHKNVQIVRIISSSIIDQKIICQEDDEWFIMIEGRAILMIAEQKKELVKGDYCFIKARQAHQVLYVEEGSIWLAVHIG